MGNILTLSSPLSMKKIRNCPFLIFSSRSRMGLLRLLCTEKNTFSGLFMNFRSFLPQTYKLGLITTLIDRIYKISQNRTIFNFEFKKVKEFLGKNSYPPHLVDKQLKKYRRKVEIARDKSEDDGNISYMKLPYIGNYSKTVQDKVMALCSNLCKKTNIKIVFTSNKISSFFSTKDKMPSELRARVIYKFKCAGCNACYVGQTTRHYDTRVHEHLNKKSQPSSVYKHLEENANCRATCDKKCFEVIDADSSSFRLEVKEAIHNEWLKPSINKQKKLLKLSILI